MTGSSLTWMKPKSPRREDSDGVPVVPLVVDGFDSHDVEDEDDHDDGADGGRGEMLTAKRTTAISRQTRNWLQKSKTT